MHRYIGNISPRAQSQRDFVFASPGLKPREMEQNEQFRNPLISTHFVTVMFGRAEGKAFWIVLILANVHLLR